jgi:predicted nuclease of predicted toxin-antitoxin system
MKRLVDAQLPIRLANHLRQMSVEALHTSELPLRNRTPDAEIKHLSITQEYVIVTKDGDFVDNLLLHQNLYKLLLVATGNINRVFRVYELPPSFRFPPLREGNRP